MSLAESTILRRCCVCKTRKPLDAFGRNKAEHDGISRECRTCANARRSGRPDVELKYMTSDNPLYIAGEAWDLAFHPNEVDEVLHMWERGDSVYAMAVLLEREMPEVLVLLADLDWQDRLPKREGWLWGGRTNNHTLDTGADAAISD